MMPVPLPPNESERLEALRRYNILDTQPERSFDDLATLAAQVCAAPLAMISLVDAGRLWPKSTVGGPLAEMPREGAFCAHAILNGELLVVPDAAADERFRDHPLVTAGIRFYAGAPLVDGDGHALGTLCVIDRAPRQLDEAQQAALAALARQVMAQLELRRQLEHEREAARMSRLYEALSQVNQSIVQTKDTAELCERVCRALVEQGGFRVAWIGWHDSETGQVTPVAKHGDDAGFLDNVVAYSQEGPGATLAGGKSFKADEPFISNDMLSDPASQAWWPELKAAGFRSTAAFPIIYRGEVKATLCVYADQPDVFHDKEIGLLQEAAGDIGFGLDTLENDVDRERAEAQAQNERRFSDTMIDSMPGILYFYDGTGRFLRWNRNFETVSGYSAEEIAMMHPLDFFDGKDTMLVGERINKVFETGEATVQANFLSKDGVRTPYFFTGRHVVYNGRDCLVGVGIDISLYKQPGQDKQAGEAPRGAADPLERTVIARPAPPADG